MMIETGFGPWDRVRTVEALAALRERVVEEAPAYGYPRSFQDVADRIGQTLELMHTRETWPGRSFVQAWGGVTLLATFGIRGHYIEANPDREPAAVLARLDAFARRLDFIAYGMPTPTPSRWSQAADDLNT